MPKEELVAEELLRSIPKAFCTADAAAVTKLLDVSPLELASVLNASDAGAIPSVVKASIALVLSASATVCA
jgi:hypothetical protein